MAASNQYRMLLLHVGFTFLVVHFLVATRHLTTQVINYQQQVDSWRVAPFNVVYNTSYSKLHTKNASSSVDSASQSREPITVGFPIFVANFPKSGTGSMAGFLECGNISTAHYRVFPRRRHPLLGECAERNLAKNRPLWDNCGSYQAFSNTEFMMFESPYNCFVPGLQGLESMYRHYPNLTVVLGTRNETQWYKSFRNWYDGGLENAWKNCDASGLKGTNATRDDIIESYQNYKQYIRSFARSHPRVNYIEVEMESPATPAILESKLGVNRSCWRVLHKS